MKISRVELRRRLLGALLAASCCLGIAAAEGLPALPGVRRNAVLQDSIERLAVLETHHVLSAGDRAILAEEGCRVIRALGGRRYLVTLNPEWNRAVASRPLVRGVLPVGANDKLDPAAKSALAGENAAPRMRVQFRDELALDAARAIVERAGGSTSEFSAFDGFHSFVAVVPRDSIFELAGRQEVLGIAGPRPPIDTENATAANVSSVTPLHGSPYGLSGAGVVLSLWDDGRTDTSHGELTGRVIAENSSSVRSHPTHVAGTIAAAGLNAAAKGMAPQAQVHQFDYNVGDWWTEKHANFSKFSISADNNSWGYQGGWERGERTYWEWWGDELVGVYAFESAQVDRLTHEHGTLVVFSSGNETGEAGPTSAPWPHYHAEGTIVYCASTDGSGNDCPSGTCGQCETSRHPADGPWDTINIAASSKNGITVGAVDSGKGIGSFSSRGPLDDGRVKPDVVADGVNLLSTIPGGAYGRSSGTSMAAPVVTGIAGLIVEQWRRSMAGEDPAPEVIKALLIGTAEDLGATGPDYTYGFGLVNATAAIDRILDDGGTGSAIATGDIRQGTSFAFPFDLPAGGAGTLTLVWSDPEIPLIGFQLSDAPLVNDLDLEVALPDGGTTLPFVLDPSSPEAAATAGINRADNVEQVVIESAAGGRHTAVVRGFSIPQGPQRFALVSTTALDIPRICEDPYEPNDTTDTAWGMLFEGVAIHPSLCDENDVDHFEFVVDRSGPVSVEVAASDSDIRAILMKDGVVAADQPIAAGSRTSLESVAGSASGLPIAPVTFIVRVEAAGLVVSIGGYSVKASYSRDVQPRRRPVRRP